MGKLRVLSGQKARAILERHGLYAFAKEIVHIVMQRLIAEGTITVPIPNHKELRTGTLRAIIRQSGLPRAEFEV